MTVFLRATAILGILLLTLVPLPSALAEDCITPRLTKSEGLRIVADAESDLLFLGVGVPDPGSGFFAAFVIRPNACTGGGDPISLTTAPVALFEPASTLPALP